MLKTKTKSIAKYFIAILSIVFVFAAAIGITANIHKPEPNQEQSQVVNNLTLNSGFTDNQYVVINGKAYSYMPSSATQSVEQTNSVKFNTNNTVELIFLKDSITQLSNFALLDNNIASVLQATKTDNGVNINILYTEQTASIETSHDAEYTLGTQALNTNNILNYTNQEFTIGTTKGSTSLLDASTSTNAKILNITGGTFQLKNTTYTGKGTGRAIAQSGGTLTLNTCTFTRFSTTASGGVVYKTGGSLTLTSCTLTGNTAASGPAVYNNAGALTLSGGSISSNTATSTSGDIYLGSSTYITLGASLTSNVSVYKAGLTSYDAGDTASSYIAYSTNGTYLTSGKTYINVNNYQIAHQHSTTLKTNYLVCDLITQYLAINPNNTTDEYYNETTYGAYISTAGTFNGSSTYKIVGREYMYQNKITVNAWAYMDTWANYAKDNYMRIYSCTEGGGWNLENSNGNIQFACYDYGVGYKTINSSKAWSSLAAGWHMFTMTFDGEYVRAYIDAQLYGTSTKYTSGKIGYNESNVIFIGAEAGSSASTPVGQYFNGKIQNFCILNDSLYSSEITDVYAAGRGNLIISKDYLETYTLDAPTKAGYTFTNWNLTGNGSIKVGQNSSWQSGFVRTNNTYYENFKFSVTKPTTNTWYNIQWPTFAFTAGHTYKLVYKIRINSISDIAFNVRLSRKSNDFYSGTQLQTYSAVTNGWVTGSLTQTFNSTFSANGTTTTTNPLVEIWTGDLSSSTKTPISIDLDIKDIVVYDVSTNTIVFASDTNYLFTTGSGSVTAQYNPNVYKVTLDNQSATTAGTAEYYYQYNTTNVINGVTCYYYTDSACTTGLRSGFYITCPTKNGYTFGGYYTGQNGAGTQYVDSSGQCVSNRYRVIGDVKLYAKWTINQYNVTFHPNGGYRVSDSNSGPVTIPYDYGHVEGISERARTGYTLTGYTVTDTDGGSNIGGATTTFDATTKTGSVTVGYADIIVLMNWTPNVYKVTLDNQSATTAGTAEYYYQYNTTKVIGGVTCYYYTTNECTTGLTSGYYISCPTKTGYTFGGYYTGQNGAGTRYVDNTGQCVNNLFQNVASDSTLYAKWTVNTYTLTFNGNSPDGSTVTQYRTSETVTYGSSSPIRQNSYHASCVGYTFTGYYTATTGGSLIVDSEGDIRPSVSGFTDDESCWIGTSDKTVYAQWRANTYTLTFDGNSPDGSTVTQTVTSEIVTYKSNRPLISNIYSASCTDYEFLGYYTGLDPEESYLIVDWEGDIKGGVPGFTNDASEWIATSDKTVYAYWRWNKYIVKFNKGNSSATGTMEDQTFTKGTAQALTKNSFQLAGRKFIGWGISSSGDVVYTDQQSVKDITSTNSITLYAKWEPITYNITFNANGGTGTMSSVNYTYSTSMKLPKCTFTKSGYVFAGWAFEPDATVVNLWDEYYLSSYSFPQEEMTLYAIWADLSGDYGIFSPAGELLASWDYLVSSGRINVSGNTLAGATGGYYYGYENTLIIPPTIKAIGEYAFEDCQAYNKVILPEGLITLEDDAFSWGGLSGTFAIPSSVTTIGNYAFYYNPGVLEYDFTNHSTVPTLGTHAFENINSNCKIYVPWNLYNSWVTATNWSTWSDYICTKEYNLVFNDVDLKLSYNSNVIGSSLNSVTVSAGDQSVTYYKVSYGQEIVINKPNRPGYTFNGWKIYRYENNEEVVISSQSFSTTFVNLTTTYQDVVMFKALWREHYYSVNVNLNGGGSIVAYINGSAHSATSSPIYMRSGSPNIYIPYNHLIVPSYYDPRTGYTYNSSATQGYVPKVVLYAERANYEFLGLYTASSGGQRIATRSGLLPNTIYTDENGCWDSTSTSITLYAQWKSTVVAPPVDVIYYEVVRNEAANSSKVGNIFIDYGGDSIITISSRGVTSNSFNLKENNAVMVSAEVSHKKFSIDPTGRSVNGVPPSMVTMYGIYVKIYQDTDTWRYGSPIFEKYYWNGDSTSHILGFEFSELSDGNVIEIHPVEVVKTQSSGTIQFISAEFDGTGGVASPALSLNMLGDGAPNGAEIWLDDKFRKLQEKQDTIVDFEGITF